MALTMREREQRIEQIRIQIAECDKAILRAMRVKAYSNSGMGLTYQDLSALRALRNDLELELDALLRQQARKILRVMPRDD